LGLLKLSRLSRHSTALALCVQKRLQAGQPRAHRLKQIWGDAGRLTRIIGRYQSHAVIGVGNRLELIVTVAGCLKRQASVFDAFGDRDNVIQRPLQT
jgi:hypothetical protein